VLNALQGEVAAQPRFNSRNPMNEPKNKGGPFEDRPEQPVPEEEEEATGAATQQ
jgi:hypothetical protein